MSKFLLPFTSQDCPQVTDSH